MPADGCAFYFWFASRPTVRMRLMLGYLFTRRLWLCNGTGLRSLLHSGMYNRFSAPGCRGTSWNNQILNLRLKTYNFSFIECELCNKPSHICHLETGRCLRLVTVMQRDRVPASDISTLALAHADLVLPECSATDASSRIFTASTFAIRSSVTSDQMLANAARMDNARARSA